MNHRITFIFFLAGVLAGCASGTSEPGTPELQSAESERTRMERPAQLPTPLPARRERVTPAIDELIELREPAAPVPHKLAQDATGQANIAMLSQVRPAHEPLYRERYQHPGDHPVVRVVDQPVSTFSIDVDTGAYSNMRRWLNQGRLPPENAVRVEEFVNYFDYDYPIPDSREAPFSVTTEVAPTPWNARTRLLRIGIQGYAVPREQLPPANLVFLVDVSGSMQSDDKLPLLRNALSLMVQELDADDSMAMVVYAGASGVVLPPTPGNRKERILSALHRLEAGGSTNGAAGIETAYRLARENFRPDGVNRIILATDGDFNVGIASTDELVDLVQRQRRAGIALTTLGFGGGNYNDHLMEQLADEGNGQYAYIDRLSEARKLLTEELSSTLLVIAGDVKIQVEFNPATVAEYRLIGYENRVLDEADFDNDQVDAGEIGAGHRVTALYEVSLVKDDFRRLPPRRYHQETQSRPARGDHGGELAHLRIRYKEPGSEQSRLIATPIEVGSMLTSMDLASADFRFAAAVAAFGQKLRGGAYLDAWDWSEIAGLASSSRGTDRFGYRGEFLQLIALAQALAGPVDVAQTIE